MKSFLPVVLLLATAPALAQDIATLTVETRKAVLPIVPAVLATMQEAVAEKGVAGAIPVCKEVAPELIKEKRKETGWDIRRVSLKTRNAERGTPDLWEVRQLAEFNIRAANGERADTMEKGEIVNIDGKQVFRYMKALPVGDVCLMCHGPQVQMKNLRFDDPSTVLANAQNIHQQVAVLRLMPMNNATGITDAERALIAAWVKAGAKTD